MRAGVPILLSRAKFNRIIGGLVPLGYCVKKILDKLANWAQALRQDALTLWFCCQHPALPWLPKMLAACIVAYVFSPIDLIPDFIPVLGLVDELIIVPIGVSMTIKLIPADILHQSRERAREWLQEKKSKPRSYVGGVAIALIWLALLWITWTAFGPRILAWLSGYL